MNQGKEYLEFNLVFKDTASVGGLQISPFKKAKTAIELDSEAGGSVTINPSDFYEADFRMLSKTIVAGDSWKCCDFSQGTVLKSALSLFDKKPVYTDHKTFSVENSIGIIKSVWWDAPSVTEDGVSVPAGVNGKFAIDTTTEKGMALARQIAIGAIFSVSVGVEFSWDASHVFEDRWEWYDNVGVIQSDGTMCRRIANKIENINECSLVHLGADPYAKLIDKAGKIVNPDYGSINVLKVLGLSKEQFTKQPKDFENKYQISCGFDDNVFALTKSFSVLDKETKSKNFMELAKILEKLGLNAADFKDFDSLLAHINSLTLVKTKATELGIDLDKATKETVVFGEALTTLKAELDGEKSKVVSLTSEKDALKLKSDKYDARLTVVRTEGETKYRAAQLAKGLEVDEAIVSLIKESDEDKATSLLKSFGLSLTEELSGSCVKCGSKEITFRSSKEGEKEPDGIDNDGNKSVYDFLHAKSEENRTFLKK